jgi:hypothetical protein
MPALKMPLPYFAKAPITYDRSYLDSVVRSFSIYLQQQNNPGDLVVATLQLLELPIFADNASAIAGGLAVDSVYKTATGDLKIVV